MKGFIFIEKYFALEKLIHKIDFINDSPNSLATINNDKSNILISLPREDAYIWSQTSSISVDFEVLKHNDIRYVDNDQTALFNFGPVAFLGSYADNQFEETFGKS